MWHFKYILGILFSSLNEVRNCKNFTRYSDASDKKILNGSFNVI